MAKKAKKNSSTAPVIRVIEELSQATKVFRKPKESEQQFFARLVKAAASNAMSDEAWDALTDPAQKWVALAAKSLKEKTPIPDPDKGVGAKEPVPTPEPVEEDEEEEEEEEDSDEEDDDEEEDESDEDDESDEEDSEDDEDDESDEDDSDEEDEDEDESEEEDESDVDESEDDYEDEEDEPVAKKAAKKSKAVKAPKAKTAKAAPKTKSGKKGAKPAKVVEEKESKATGKVPPSKSKSYRNSGTPRVRETREGSAGEFALMVIKDPSMPMETALKKWYERGGEQKEGTMQIAYYQVHRILAQVQEVYGPLVKQKKAKT